MTMRITVKNEDTQRIAKITMRDRSPVDGMPGTVPENVTFQMSEVRELAPGASTEVWIHSGRDFIVEEIA